MIFQSVIARRYARGLLLASLDEDVKDIEEQLKSLINALNDETSKLAHLFLDPSFSPLERAAVIDRLAREYGFNKVLHHFLLLLCKKGRLNLLGQIYEELVSYILEKEGKVVAHVQSSKKLDLGYVNDLKSALSQWTKKDVLIETNIDERLLGGVSVTVLGTTFDATVKGKLNELKAELTH